MSNFKERLIAERDELEEKLNKLNDFNADEKVLELGDEVQGLLTIQAGAMYTYLQILNRRLDLLEA